VSDGAGTPTPPETLAALIGDLGGRPLPEGRLGRLQARAVALAERLTTWGPVGPLAEMGWRIFRRDQSIAGSVMASALAYRLFIWILPLALLLVAGLGPVADAIGGDPADYVEDAGLPSYVAESVGAATDGLTPLGLVAVLVSTSVVLLYETYVLLRALRAVSAFSWGVPVRSLRHPVPATLTLLGLLVGLLAVGALTGRIADAAGGLPFGWILAIVSLTAAPILFVLMFVMVLPHVMVGAIHLFNALILYPWVGHKEATYGALGVAAGIMLSLFVTSRALVVATALNAVLQDDRRAAAGTRP
jgi:uncharacterized BrkB/YihY/UPF0761 family membrane protein